MKYKCLIKISIVLLALPSIVSAADMQLGSSALMSNKYVWRGMSLTNGAVLQPSVSAGYESFSFNVWGNMDISDVNQQNYSFTEIDYNFDYSVFLGSYNLSFGSITYQFPNSDVPTTSEAYAALGIKNVINPSISIFADIDEFSGGIYSSFSVTPVLPLKIFGISPETFFAVGIGSAKHNRSYYSYDKTTLTDFMATVSLPVELGNNIALVPMIGYSSLLGDEIRARYGKKDNFLIGFTLTVDL